MDNRLLNRLVFAGVVTGVLALPAQVLAQAQADSSTGRLQINIGTDYSAGKFGNVQATKITSIPFSVKYTRNKWTFKASSAYIRLQGPGALIDTPGLPSDGFTASDLGGSEVSGSGSNGSGGSGSNGSGSGGSGSSGSSGSSGGGGSTSGGSGGNSGSGSSGGSGGGTSGGHGSGGGSGSSGTSTSTGSTGTTGSTVTPGTGGVVVLPGSLSQVNSGIGDVLVSATYSTELDDKGLFLDIVGKIKLPTASVAKRLGTGKADTVIGAELTKVVGKFSIYGGARYRVTGKSTIYDLHNTAGASLGVGYDMGHKVSLTLDYDYQQSPFQGGEASRELTGSVTVKAKDNVRIQIYVSHGFEKFAADTAGGLQVIYRFY